MSQHHYHEIEEIISSNPKRIIKSGTIIIIITLACLISLAFIIRYPDIITAECVIESETPMFTLRAPRDGIIDTILFRNGDTTSTGEIIAIIKNTLSYPDYLEVTRIASQLKTSKETNYELIFKMILSKDIDCGDEINRAIKSLQGDILSYRIFINDSTKQLTINRLQRRVENLNRKNIITKDIINLKKQELENALQWLQKDSALLMKGIISVKKFEENRNNYLSLKEALLHQEKEFISSKTEEIDAVRQIAILKNEIICNKQRVINSINESNGILHGVLKQWESNNTINAGLNGIVTLDGFIHQGHSIKSGEQIGSVIQNREVQHIAGVSISVSGKGKVKCGQRVIVSLDQYPAKEFGVIRGYIDNLSEVPVNGTYHATLKLPSLLKTSYGISLPYQNYLSGKAEIITTRHTLAEQIMQYSFFINKYNEQ